MVKHVERTFAGRPLKMETGRLAKQAAGACLIQFGETVVLATVTVSDQVSTQSFFPLTVEYREKAYAAGKIPGGFLKREGRPSDEEILSARVADRTFQQLEFSDVDMIVSGSRDSIVMVEGGALELTEAEIVKALEVAHKGIRELLKAADELIADVRRPKMEWTKVEAPADLVARVKAL